jgi:anti-sigma regulatory factor (Ser/Thr protein kinase)
MSTGSRGVDRCAHTAILYHSEQEYLKFVGAFLLDGLSRGESAWVAVPAARMDPLRDKLSAAAGASADDVRWVDVSQLGRNPGRLLGAELAFLAGHRRRPIRMITEVMWAARRDYEYAGCLQHEALSNVAFDGSGVTSLCPYDASQLTPEVLDDVWMTHPAVEEGGARELSDRYSLEDALNRGNEPLTTSPVAVTFTVSEPADLSRARQHGTRYGRLLGLSPDRIADLQLVVTELATNGLQHGGGHSRLAFWEHQGHLVCEARDTGYLVDPLVGRRPPAKDRPSPSGLFVVHALADLVRTHTSPQGTTIQAYLRLDRPTGEVA